MSNTIPGIADFRPRWAVDVLVPPEHIPTAQAAFGHYGNVKIVPCAIPPFSRSEQTALHRFARGYDLTWFTNYWVPLAWRGRFAVTVHDMLHLMPEFTPASVPKRLMSRLTFSKVRRDARAVMFDSRFTEEAFRRKVGVPRVGSTVQLGGDHLDYGAPKSVSQRSKRLLVVAAPKKHKNFELLFEAWRRARVAPHWTLTIISPQEMLRNSVNLAAMAGQEGRIDIRRGVSNTELAALYADSAILLMPSLYEGFGLPLLEGMLAGALCVSSNAGSMVEIAEGAFVHFVNGPDLQGWVASIQEACAIVDRGTPDLDTLLSHNIARARRFRWQRTAEQVASVLEAAAA